MRGHDLRRLVYDLLEHDNIPHTASARLAHLIIAVIIINVITMVLASVPEIDARYGPLLIAIEVGSLAIFVLEYVARFWSVAGHAPVREMSPWRARLDYATSSLGIIDLLSVLPSGIALLGNERPMLVMLGMLPFFKLVRYSTAMRSLLEAIQAERRTLFGCLVILVGAVLAFSTLLYAIEHEAQPDKFGSIPLAMWWAIVTLGTVGYGDVVPVTPMGKTVASFAIVGGLMMIALPVAIISRAFANEIGRHDFIVTWGMLARVPLFAHLRAAEIADIMRLLRTQTIETGEILVRRGEPASSMYFITAGEVEIELPAQRVRLADGSFFGEIALLQRTQRSGTVTALRRSNLLALDAQDFHALIARAPKLAAHVQEVVKARLADTAQAQKGDIAPDEIARAAQTDQEGGVVL
ncbi:cyclic nucleotide-gated ion channel [Bradyrhizobium sp.]|uniref:cyclic nucleotide-gated ion channel n=1 Tax=Bradyrhizobium sp. TaxID=376 RepID=UPI000AFE8E5C|nr:cyclic nucleotide-gated ion channel [Bradyrhizobium sp.]